jgi:valyl-tRNA synthetase
LAFRYQGMERFTCRKLLVEELKKVGLMQKVEPITHSVGHSERTGVIVEPRLSKQWFVKMDMLAKNAIDKHQVSFVPERFEKIFKNWMDGIEDWCISRQLWWGHRIPVWYKDDELYCGKESPSGDGWRQDEDVLDTWFSSALWPFSTLGWPNNTLDFARYYPTNVLVTGYDIIFFWVARMIFQAIEFTNQSPFKECLIHGLIRDADGKKMSKSLGNGVDPKDVIEQFGADALRYFISTNSSPGLDLRYEVEKVESSWNFINKLWNMSRFVLINTEGFAGDNAVDESTLGFPEQYILQRMNQMIMETDAYFEKYEFGEAAKVIYNFAWNDFASWYVEMAKVRISKASTKHTLLRVLTTIIQTLHPFMPFVTEEIYQMLPQSTTSICVSSWPQKHSFDYPHIEEASWFFELIRKIRTIRNDYNVSMTKPIELSLAFEHKSHQVFFEANIDIFQKFCNTSLKIVPKLLETTQAISLLLPSIQGSLPLGSLVDLTQERNKLEKELEKLEAEIKRSIGLLNNPSFKEKAPAEKIAVETAKYQNYLDIYQQTKERIEALKN